MGECLGHPPWIRHWLAFFLADLRGGGARDVCPLLVQFFFIFMQFSAKILPIIFFSPNWDLMRIQNNFFKGSGASRRKVMYVLFSLTA